MADSKRLEPQFTAPSEASFASGRLPDDLISEQVKRVALAAAVGTGLWSFGFVMDGFFVPRAFASPLERTTLLVETVGIALSATIFAFVKYGKGSSQLKTDLGLVYMVFSAIAVAIIRTQSAQSLVRSGAMGSLSWAVVVILVGSMIMASTPRRVFTASLIAASMDPLLVWIAHLRGLPVPSIFTTLVVALPNYICACVAILPSAVLRRLGLQLREAQAMGSYKLIELLGRGGMGEVWLAEHRLLARTAALKVVRPEVLGASSELDARNALLQFEREARATAALSSPHTIRLFDFGMTREGAFYYAMELLMGRDLESLVREFGPLPSERVVYLLRQVCHSLADAHARGLVHRDIKPANIYVCRMGLDYDFVKVLDFGLVKFKNSRVEETLVHAEHSATGTPAYMAPEVILGSVEVDRRADVYSLGCVAYYLLTGQLVFQADSPIQMLMEHVEKAPVPPSMRTELPIPAELDELVMACLAKDPNDRPGDASQLYKMTCACAPGEFWGSNEARSWWEQHLTELTGPLTASEPPPGGTATTVIFPR